MPPSLATAPAQVKPGMLSWPKLEIDIPMENSVSSPVYASAS